MRIIRTVALGAAVGLGLISAAATPALAITPFSVSFESEAPGMQATTATFSAVGVENFDSRALGNGTSFVTDFGSGGAFTGTYSGADILSADQYGGAYGSGRYAATFSDTGFTLDISSTVRGGANYFGYWLSALDPGNKVSFYRGSRLLFTFNPQDVINAVQATGNPSAYYGNPNVPFLGQNSGEPYLFVNFFANSGRFDRVVFQETPMVGGYESDNHTVGRFLTKGTGTEVPITSGFVPEPASWAMLIAGFGLVGTTMRRRRRMARVSA
jgi:hypothetical protein